MKKQIKLSLLFVLLLLFAVSSIRAQDEYFKWEGFAGYSYMNLNRGVDPDEFNDELGDTRFNRVNAHGFNGAVTYNFQRFVGAKFDITLHSHGEDVTGVLLINPLRNTPQRVAGVGTPATFKVSQNIYQYMGGIQIRDNNKEGPRFRPFAHILAGLADQHFSLDETSPGNARIFDVNSTDWAMKFGGGADIVVQRNFSIRSQFDWNPIVRGDQDFGPNIGVVNGTLQNNWMLTFGGAFHF